MPHDERGMSNSVQTALLFPLVLSVLWLAMQWAMLSWAHATAQAAAQDAARSAAAHGSSAAHGQQQALRAAESGALDTISVTVTRGTTFTTATVTGRALQVIPGFPTEYTVTATAPTQTITGG